MWMINLTYCSIKILQLVIVEASLDWIPLIPPATDEAKALWWCVCVRVCVVSAWCWEKAVRFASCPFYFVSFMIFMAEESARAHLVRVLHALQAGQELEGQWGILNVGGS